MEPMISERMLFFIGCGFFALITVGAIFEFINNFRKG